MKFFFFYVEERLPDNTIYNHQITCARLPRELSLNVVQDHNRLNSWQPRWIGENGDATRMFYLIWRRKKTESRDIKNLPEQRLP